MRVENLEAAVKKAAEEAAKVREELSALPTISAQLSALDRLVTYRMDDLSRQFTEAIREARGH